MLDQDKFIGVCDHDECGELECDIDHDDEDFDGDGDWMFDGSGMVGDD